MAKLLSTLTLLLFVSFTEGQAKRLRRGQDQFTEAKSQRDRRDLLSLGTLFDGSWMNTFDCNDDETTPDVPTSAPGVDDPNENASPHPTSAPVPAPAPVGLPNPTPTSMPAGSPTADASPSPTNIPTESPTPSPIKLPTQNPTVDPTSSPTASPTQAPTDIPTSHPTPLPTDNPTVGPSNTPTQGPTESPTSDPSTSPSTLPTTSPTASPTTSPTSSPTTSPTTNPSIVPTAGPSTSPTYNPTKSPTSDPTQAPTASPTTIEHANAMKQIDNDLLEVARVIAKLGLDTSEEFSGGQPTMTLEAKVDSFVRSESRSDSEREDLQKELLTGLSRANREQFQKLIDPESDDYSTVIQGWNDQGTDVRADLCDLIGGSESMVSEEVRECMCNNADPFVRCNLMLGSSALEYHARRRRERLLEEEPEDTEVGEEAGARATCDIKSSPPQLLGGTPDLKSLLQAATGDTRGISLNGFCAFELNPPPLNLLQIRGDVALSVPDLPWMTNAGAVSAISDGSIPSKAELVEIAESTRGRLSGSLCFAVKSYLEKAGLGIILDILKFIGISLCPAEIGLEVWPIRGHGQLYFKIRRSIFFFQASLGWQPSTELRDTLGLCDNVGARDCSKKDGLFCSMKQGETVGSLDIGLNFLIWNPSMTFFIGESIYDDCDKWNDGTLCGLGTTCNQCKNGASYWWGKAMTACGSEPRWSDGTLCGLGTTCNQCENGASYWWGKAMTACGAEPKWSDGTLCGLGTTCNQCKNKASYWFGKAMTACGSEPKWPDGTVCGLGTTCDQCKNTASYWYGKAFTACGREPCWNDGTTCLAGTSCNSCCNGHSWWTSKAITKCGNEPCWGAGTVCGTGTTCHECCSGNSKANCPWYQLGVCNCT